MKYMRSYEFRSNSMVLPLTIVGTALRYSMNIPILRAFGVAFGGALFLASQHEFTWRKDGATHTFKCAGPLYFD